MQAVVKTRHIEIQIKGTIPPRILNALQEEYGGQLKLLTDEGEKLVNVFETNWGVVFPILFQDYRAWKDHEHWKVRLIKEDFHKSDGAGRKDPRIERK